MDNIVKQLRFIIKDNPNDSDLGRKIRHFFWQIDKENTKKLNAKKAASNQVDLEDLIRELNSKIK